MGEIPQEVLSEAFGPHIEGHQLVAAVFLTFMFDPDFFEQEVLPVFIDETVSHAEVVRVVQLEAALSKVPRRLAVYYDQNGLTAGAKPARLDVARIPVSQAGIFHPKNVFALYEQPGIEDEPPTRKLVVASMSANLTRAGWWENVETCHIETISSDERSSLRDDVRKLLKVLLEKTRVRAADDHASLREIDAFLSGVTQRMTRSTEGVLHTHFFDGTGRFVDFLERTAGKLLQGCDLEVISPYLDDTAESKPLQELIDRFAVRNVRLFLPRGEADEVRCNKDLYEWVKNHKSITWGRLPSSVTQLGKQADTKHRFVHAKVYRFFGKGPMKEFIFTGSVNLTTAAHQRGGNLETGFLLDTQPTRIPEWWLEEDRSRAGAFVPASEDEGTASESGARLMLRFDWGSGLGQALWCGKEMSPALVVTRAGIEVLRLNGLPPDVWISIDPTSCENLRRALESSSILMVEGDRPEPVPTLVQEEGMEHRPSLLLTLSPADILKYWTLLSKDQRAAFIESRAAELLQTEEGSALVSRQGAGDHVDSFFERFAGIFVSFSELEASIRAALSDATPREREAKYRLFGEKYDSLGHLLTRIEQDLEANPDRLIEYYVMALCAKQMVREIGRAFPYFWARHAPDVATLKSRVRLAESLREQVRLTGDSSMGEFLEWFEAWFLERAKPAPEEVTA